MGMKGAQVQSTFTARQQDAIAHTRGNLQLIACAGSGKTEVVAQRIVNLLRPVTAGGAGCAPENIVAFTFTEKAAAELKERVHTRSKEQLGNTIGLANLYVGTIHGYCLELLKSEIPKYLKFEVLNEVQLSLFVDRHSKASGLTLSTTLSGVPLRRYVDTRNYIAALSILREDDVTDPAPLINNSVAANRGAYEQLLNARGYLDYSSILAEAVQAMRGNDALRQRLALRVQHVIVDEYQDVNPIQESIVEELHTLGASVCVVGDDDQTVYQFRGSDVQNILGFENRYPPVTPVRLEDNFRSSEGIVSVARDFIRRVVPRLEKEMKSTHAQEYEEGDLVALGFDSPDEEADYIAQTCKSLHGVAVRERADQRGMAWSDMAILLRSVRGTGKPFAEALKRADVPYIITGMDNLFEQPEVEAARQLFYFLAGKADETTLRETWERANLGIGKSALSVAIAEATKARRNMKKADLGQFQVYNLQRQFIAFLENAELREERVPNEHGEVVFYNLGKFSQAISDFESIHFRSEPVQKYESFAGFLEHHAENAYPEGWQDNVYASPDAVRIMTVHQAKGLQWPAVFIPQLVRNRFPSIGSRGRTPWHLIPVAAFKNAERYKGTESDERRLFYVAITRAQKFLHMTWAPTEGNSHAQRPSGFLDEVRESLYVKRSRQEYAARSRLRSQPKASVANVRLSFSDMKYFLECPYQFKLRILYGFNAPLAEALGYGKSLHDALAEVHSRAMHGEIVDPAEASVLVERHLRAPYAYPALREKLAAAAKRVIEAYIRKNQQDFSKVEFTEKPIEIALGDGVSVVGRIDLVRRLDTGEVTIVDLKSNDRVQREEITESQLHIYALGYQDLTGRRADYVETYELDNQKQIRRPVGDEFMEDVKRDVHAAAKALRGNNLGPKPEKKICGRCDYCNLCSAAVQA
jgi:DNA helicase II / ATP-dependent DNA helicase PcrA